MNEREAIWHEHQRRRWMRPVAHHAPTWTGKRGRWMPNDDRVDGADPMSDDGFKRND